MSNLDGADPRYPPVVKIGDACPGICANLTKELRLMGEIEASIQVNEFWVAFQELPGTPEDFSFMGYRLPGPTFEERVAMEFLDDRSIDVDLLGGHIKIMMNGFNQMNWYYVSGLPTMYRDLIIHMRNKKAANLPT